jgi:hypothetical protein
VAVGRKMSPAKWSCADLIDPPLVQKGSVASARSFGKRQSAVTLLLWQEPEWQRRGRVAGLFIFAYCL